MPKFFKLMFKTAYLSTLILFSVAPVFAATTTNPTINLFPAIYYSGSEVFHLEGTGQPSSNVEIVFSSTDWSQQEFTVGTDLTGKWTFIQRVSLDKGRWDVKVRESDVSNSGQVVWSDPVSFVSIPTQVAFGGMSIQLSTFNTLVIGGFLSLILIIILSVYRFRSVQKQVEAFRVGSAESVIKSKIENIRKQTAEELWRLEKKLKKEGKFTQEEADSREQLLRNLKKNEEAIESEMIDIL